VLVPSLLLAWVLLQERGGAPAPLRDTGPAAVEVRCVDLEGETVHGAEWRFAFEDAHGGSIEDLRVPSGQRQGMRFDSPPRSSEVDAALGERGWSSSALPRIELQAERGLLIEARRGDEWGFLWLPRDWRATAGRGHREGEPLTLELAPDWDLLVRVEDAGGRPTKSARVGLSYPELKYADFRSDLDEYVFAHVGHDARRAREALFVRVDELLDPPVEARIDPRHPPRGPVVLRLPPTGGVEVRVHGIQNEARHPAFVELAFEGEPRGVHALTRESVARFGPVSLGRRLVASLESSGDPWRVELDGPRWAGEVVEATITLAADAPEPRSGDLPALNCFPPRSLEASFDGFVLVDPGVPLAGIELELTDAAGQPQGGRSPGRDGRFRISARPGPARVEVFPSAAKNVLDEERPVVFRRNLELQLGDNPLPELDAIDLRGKLFAHTLRLSGLVSGRGIDACVLFGPSTWPASQRCYTRVRGLPLTVVSAWPEIDLELYVHGYRAVHLRDLGRERVVELEPGLQVELRLAGAALPEPPWRLAAALQPPERLMRVNDWDAPAFDGHHVIRTTAFGPGVNQVVWQLMRPGGGSSYLTTQPQFVHVLESSGSQVFTLELPPEDLARWLEESR
jgi:hypothetical protein